jgi:maltooligosyltrehalose trehalohydrolase
MHTFRVWAPLPKKVEVQVGGERHPMTAEPDGWWSADIASAGIGDRYGYILDGAGPFPDPCSPAQPEGVHLLSQLTNPNSHVWYDTEWRSGPLASGIIYELHVGTFTPEGTFLSAIARLDHLVALGVTHVELMPVAEFSGNRGWGYDSVGLFAPHHAYGAPDDLKQLVAACHRRGLGAILDVVYNHLGPSGNYLGKYAPYFSRRYAPTWGEALNFDGPESDQVRRFFCNNALMWLRDFHFDGLRLDAVHAMNDFSAQPFLEQLKLEVEQLSFQLGRPLWLIAESDLNDPRLLWPRERGGFALDAQWSDDFHHALHTVLTGEKNGYYADFGKLEDLAKAMHQVFVYDGKFSAHRRRRHGRPAGSLSGHCFLGYLQNHDQIGNRAQGERSSHLLSIEKAKIGAALVLTSPFVPLLFQGEEWGASTPFLYFTDFSEPELANNVREGRCREFAAFGWNRDAIPNPQSPETFARSKLNWFELPNQPHCQLLDWYRRLIHLRNAEPALHDGRLELVNTQFDESARWLIMERGNITVACNLANQPQKVPLRSGEHRTLLASESDVNVLNGSVSLPPESVAILTLGQTSSSVPSRKWRKTSNLMELNNQVTKRQRPDTTIENAK